MRLETLLFSLCGTFQSTLEGSRPQGLHQEEAVPVALSGKPPAHLQEPQSAGRAAVSLSFLRILAASHFVSSRPAWRQFSQDWIRWGDSVPPPHNHGRPRHEQTSWPDTQRREEQPGPSTKSVEKWPSL